MGYYELSIAKNLAKEANTHIEHLHAKTAGQKGNSAYA